MSPTVIVLNVSAAIFLALFLIFLSFLLVRYRKMRQSQLIAKDAKEILLYTEEEPVVKHRAKYKLAKAE